MVSANWLSLFQVVYKILTGKVLEMPEEEEDTNPADMMDTEINAMLEVDIGGTKPNIIKVTFFASS